MSEAGVGDKVGAYTDGPPLGRRRAPVQELAMAALFVVLHVLESAVPLSKSSAAARASPGAARIRVCRARGPADAVSAEGAGPRAAGIRGRDGGRDGGPGSRSSK